MVFCLTRYHSFCFIQFRSFLPGESCKAMEDIQQHVCKRQKKRGYAIIAERQATIISEIFNYHPVFLSPRHDKLYEQ